MATKALAHYQLIDGAKSIEISNLQRWEQLGNVPWRDESIGVHRHYAAVPFVYRCVDIRANALSGMPWALVRGETDVWSSEEPVPPADLRMFGPLPDWLWVVESALCLTATAYLYKLRNRVRVVDLRWLDPTLIVPVVSARDGITGWRRNVPGSEIPQELALDDVVAIWLRGLGEVSPRVAPAQAAMEAAGASYNLQSFVSQFFARGAIKATLLAVPTNTLKEDRDRLKSWWNRFMSGMQNAWGSAVINADTITPVVVGEGLGELSNAELTTSLREDIATAMGVPHSLVLSNASNFATSQQDELNFYNLTILPEARQVQRQLNKQLFEPMGLRFEFRPNELTIFQQDENERAAALKLYVDAGLKLSVAAEILGVDLPEGVTYEQLDEAAEEARELERQAAQAQMQALQARSQPQDNGPQRNEQRDAEVRRFRSWAKKRKEPDPHKFASELLSDADKHAILADMEDGAAEDAPFPVAWTNYP